MKFYWFLTIKLLVISVFLPLSVYSQKSVILDSSFESLVLGPYTAVLIDPTKQLTFQDILKPTNQEKFKVSTAEVFRAGFTNTIYWFRFILENQSNESQEWILDFPYRTMDWVELHRPLPSGEYQMTRVGDIFPISARDIPHDHYLFRLLIPPQEKVTYYFHANSQGGAMVVPLILSTPITFYQNHRVEQTIWGIFFGIMGILFFYSFFQYLSIKDTGYLFYSLTLLVGSISYLILSGWGKFYIWAETDYSINNLLPESMTVTMLFYLLYCRSLLETKKYLPRMDVVLRGSCVLLVALLVISPFLPYGLWIQISNLNVLWALTMGIPICFLRYRQKYEPALYPLLGAFAMVVTAGVTIYQTTYGHAPIGVINYPSIFGILIDILMLSFALSSRYKILRSEKETVQQEKLEIQQTLVEELKRADQLKDDFLANTSHELSTPLHGIIGICQAMGRTDYPLSPEEQQRNLHLITNSARRLSHLVNDILDFSRIKNQDLRLRQHSIEIQGVIQLVSQLCEISMGQKPVEIVKEVPNVPIYVYADEERLQQVLFNLLSNAIKFTHEGRITIKVECQDQQVWLSVSDTGIGIAQENQEIIFKPFTQADSSISREYGGTGLGLAISQQLVRLHGSELKVESVIGQGTTFSFTLPLSLVDDKEASTIEAPLHAHPLHLPNLVESQATVSPSSPKVEENASTILIVDDEPLNLEILKYQLIQEGYQVQKALDGFQALAILQQQLPDLILLDLMMPRMNGYEVCQKIRESYTAAELPIIILTAKGQMADLVAGLREGANDYLTKPFYQEELLARIKNQITQRKAVRVLQENERLSWEIIQVQQAELRLKLSENRLSKILNRSKEAILAVNDEGLIIFCNQSIAESLGYSTDQLVNQSLSFILPEESLSHCLEWPPNEDQWNDPETFQVSVLKKKNGDSWPCRIWGGELDLEEGTWIFTIIDSQNAPINATLVVAQWIQSLSQNRTRLQGFIDILQELPEVLLDSQPEFLTNLNEMDQSLEKLSEWVQPSKQEQLFEQLLVQVMNDSIACWEGETQKTPIDLAEESNLWAVNIDGDRLRARAMERYMDLNKLPKKPRWRNVIKTGHFVLTQSGASSPLKTQLQQSLNHLLQVIHQRNLSPLTELGAMAEAQP